MTVIGVTDDQRDTPAKVEKYIKEHNVEYLIALQGGQRYATRGIPAAWLVAPNGKVVWQGNPLTGAEEIKGAIEEYVVETFPVPEIELPPELKRAQAYWARGAMAKAIRELEKVQSDDSEAKIHEAAKRALAKIEDFGKSQLSRVTQYAEEGRYGCAQDVLGRIEKTYRGTDIGAEARQKLTAWKKDKVIKTEVTGSRFYRQARDLIYARDYTTAAQLLARVLKSKKYEGTRVRELAEKKLNEIKAKL